MHPAAPLRPFLDWPVQTDPDAWAPVPAAVLGLPFSQPYPGEPRPNEQARAPEAIRAQSGQFCDGPDHWDFDLGGPLRGLLPDGGRDGGNLAFDPGGPALAAGVAVLRRHFATARLGIVLGGDHGVTIPALMALEGLGRPVHLVQIDAHIDWRDHVGGARLGYSSPMRRASEMPWISGLTQIGLRGTGSARAEEVAAARAHGATFVPAAEVHARGLAPVLRHLDGRGPFYLTIDADGLDPSVMPAVMGPVPGGLRLEQVLPLIRALGRQGLVGMDVVEVAPALDLPNRITAITAGRLVLNAIAAALAPAG